MEDFYVLFCLRDVNRDGSDIRYQIQGLYFEKRSAFRKLKQRGWLSKNVDYVLVKASGDLHNFDISRYEIVVQNCSGIPFRW